MTSPNPGWKPGDKIAYDPGSYQSLDPRELSVAERYKLLIGSVIPRPIAFISTINEKGEGNLAPFSFFNGVSSNPLCLSVSFSRRADGSKKDTLINIEKNGEFVVNSAHGWFAEALVHCALFIVGAMAPGAG